MTSCEGRFWHQGEMRRCSQTVGLSTWTDHTGTEHAGCPRHRGGLLRRYPETMPERTAAPHGILGLSSPWARGLFGPAEIATLEDEIPVGYTIGVSVKANRSAVIVWVNRGGDLLMREDRRGRDGIAAVRFALDWLSTQAVAS
jgi:hypothetical protein